MVTQELLQIKLFLILFNLKLKNQEKTCIFCTQNQVMASSGRRYML